MQLILRDDKGEEITRTRSEFDGFFAIPRLASGQYKLVIDPEQATRFALDYNGGVEFTLEDDTAILPGVELHLTALNAVTVD